MTFFVYRIYNHRGDLLYIGCTDNFKKRMYGHKCGSRWYGEMAYRILKEFDCREKALAVEARAIWMLEPVFNVTHQKDEAERRKGWA